MTQALFHQMLGILAGATACPQALKYFGIVGIRPALVVYGQVEDVLHKVIDK